MNSSENDKDEKYNKYIYCYRANKAGFGGEKCISNTCNLMTYAVGMMRFALDEAKGEESNTAGGLPFQIHR